MTRAVASFSILIAAAFFQCREPAKAKNSPTAVDGRATKKLKVKPGHSKTAGREDPIHKGAFPTGFGEKRANLRVAEETRLVDIYLPQKRQPRPPLIIVLHGSGGTGRGALWKSGVIELANEVGFIAIAPQARSMKKGDWDNHEPREVYWETFPNTDPQKNPDLRFMRKVIEEAKKTYGIDTSRIYLMGVSNGGFFTTLMADTMGDAVAAFSTSSSGLVRCARTAGCNFKGRAASCAVLAKEKGYCSCKGPAKPTDLTKSQGRKPPAQIYHAADDDIVSVYFACELATALKAAGYKVSVDIRSKGGHGWPKNYARTIWPFFSRHSLPSK